MTHTRAKDQGQRSVGSKVNVEINEWMDGQTDRDDCITFPANAVGNQSRPLHFVYLSMGVVVW